MPHATIPFPGPDPALPPAAPAVPVCLGDLLDACGAGGATCGRMWVEDFRDDAVLVSADLAEVLHAARHLAAGRYAAEPRRRAA